jgi:NifB/MoaA-like Fe-S oxidoreductase
VKDDDFRLSFLYGNYTTLTRFTEFDLERVIEEGLSPLYVSIHTTNPQLRASMLRNPRGATSLRWLRALLDAGVEVHGQVVVCPGVNDGAELERTLDDALTLYPQLASIALVPLGVSDFSNEPDMRPHEAAEAAAVVDLAERVAALATDVLDRPLVFASDEFYLVAGRRPPAADASMDLDEAENGVGLVAAFERSFRTRASMERLGSGFFQSVDGAPAWGYRAPRAPAGRLEAGERVVVLTGEYAAPLLRDLLDEHGFTGVEVRAVANTYFGGNIKVAGLLTGHDLARELALVDESVTCLVPDVCLNEGRFLDGTTLADLPRAVSVVRTTGRDLREALEAVGAGDLVPS